MLLFAPRPPASSGPHSKALERAQRAEKEQGFKAAYPAGDGPRSQPQTQSPSSSSRFPGPQLVLLDRKRPQVSVNSHCDSEVTLFHVAFILYYNKYIALKQVSQLFSKGPHRKYFRGWVQCGLSQLTNAAQEQETTPPPG